LPCLVHIRSPTTLHHSCLLSELGQSRRFDDAKRTSGTRTTDISGSARHVGTRHPLGGVSRGCIRPRDFKLTVDSLLDPPHCNEFKLHSRRANLDRTTDPKPVLPNAWLAHLDSIFDTFVVHVAARHSPPNAHRAASCSSDSIGGIAAASPVQGTAIRFPVQVKGVGLTVPGRLPLSSPSQSTPGFAALPARHNTSSNDLGRQGRKRLRQVSEYKRERDSIRKNRERLKAERLTREAKIYPLTIQIRPHATRFTTVRLAPKGRRW
jgi:hypothetical protein